jgi:hypothetical protein
MDIKKRKFCKLYFNKLGKHELCTGSKYEEDYYCNFLR